MPNFTQSRIYKIVSNLPALEGKCYVGSTTKQYLSQRMANHRDNCKTNKPSQLYQVMREHGVENFDIVLLETFPCASREELNSRERYWVEQLNSINNGWNTRRPLLTRLEHRQLIKEHIARYIRDRHHHCELCNLAFASDRALRRHLLGRLHAGTIFRDANNNLFCSACNYQAPTISNYKRHCTSHMHSLMVRSDQLASTPIITPITYEGEPAVDSHADLQIELQA